MAAKKERREDGVGLSCHMGTDGAEETANRVKVSVIDRNGAGGNSL